MKTGQTAPKNIDEYIAGFPPEIQEILEKIRLTIRKAAPKAEETIRSDRQNCEVQSDAKLGQSSGKREEEIDCIILH